MVFGRGQNLQKFPLLRKVPLTSAVSEILKVLESVGMRFIAR